MWRAAYCWSSPLGRHRHGALHPRMDDAEVVVTPWRRIDLEGRRVAVRQDAGVGHAGTGVGVTRWGDDVGRDDQVWRAARLWLRYRELRRRGAGGEGHRVNLERIGLRP